MHAPRVTEAVLADCVASIACSGSMSELGLACQRAVSRLVGTPTLGFYLLDGSMPVLKYSHQVDPGMLDDYTDRLGANDPLIESLHQRPVATTGMSIYGDRDWRHSEMFRLLRRWGYDGNLCGPLCLDGALAGILYTAGLGHGGRSDELVRARMDIICRASSMALDRIAESGFVAHAPSGGCAEAALPPRSAEVARLVRLGRSNKEIARAMAISENTVKEHVANLRHRFGVRNRTELAARLSAQAGRAASA
ncbi:LuxR C-terminal-related transcriptional regulator [Nitratireductor sp. StC3]|uniref:helix-turn-helix transcriptional regulator n=1 Tax=Nitratireductor sp. StC3 TaxID=2126741 RepID=UPI001FE203CD|nr:LuxR C-terminal-related transcriptional regulator [Nitratireductor sp. StC3]